MSRYDKLGLAFVLGVTLSVGGYFTWHIRRGNAQYDACRQRCHPKGFVLRGNVFERDCYCLLQQEAPTP